MCDYTFSIANQSDSRLLSTLFKTVYIETYGIEGVTDEFVEFIEKQFSIKQIEEYIVKDNCNLWVAKYKNNPVGVIQTENIKECPIGNFSSPEINKLYVLRNFYGQGIGQRLLKKAETAIRNIGNDKIWLWVLESNERAVNFYSKQGYRDIGTAYFQMSKNRYQNLVMLKNL